MKTALWEIVSFFKSHWPHILIGIPAACAFTALHELAHCLAVWAQGGTVIEFAWLPTGKRWGYIRYVFPPDASFSEAAVSFSPYALWILFCLIAWILSLRRSPWPFWAASAVFVWLFLVPMADIANAAFPYVLWNADNDFRHAFGPCRPSMAAAVLLAGALAVGVGYHVHRRLYRDRAVGLQAYGIVAATVVLLVAVVA